MDAAHNECGNNRQCQRDAQAKRSAFADAGVDLDFAANLLHVGLHHIHAHPTSAHIGDGGGGGKSGKENQLEQLAPGLKGGPVGGDESSFDRFRTCLIDRDARTVVGDLDDDVAAFLHGAQTESSFRVLARCLAHVRWFDAVIERVAHSVRERVLDGFKKTLI